MNSMLPEYIHIATKNYRGRTVFTYEYNYYDVKYGWEARAFIGHCISQWSDEFEHLLDYYKEGRTPRELEVVGLSKDLKNLSPSAMQNGLRNYIRQSLFP